MLHNLAAILHEGDKEFPPMSKRKPLQIEILETEAGRLVVATYEDGEVIRTPVDPTLKPRRKPRKPYARAKTDWMDHTRKKRF
jgi:hypothetical protein